MIERNGYLDQHLKAKFIFPGDFEPHRLQHLVAFKELAAIEQGNSTAQPFALGRSQRRGVQWKSFSSGGKGGRPMGVRHYSDDCKFLWMAERASSSRSETPSLSKILWRWFFTVCSLMNMRCAISRFLNP